MNTETVQQEIQNVINKFHATLHPRQINRQYPPAKHQMKTLEELGILDLMPSGFGHGDAKTVIEAAQADEQVGFNRAGEGDVTSASSKLYDLLHEANEEQSMSEQRVLTVQERHELALLIREQQILRGGLERAKRKYPKGEGYGILTDIYHGLSEIDFQIFKLTKR